MKSWKLICAGLALSLALATACKPEKHEHDDEHGHEGGEQHDEAKGGKTEGNLLHVDPGALRDLRLTTQAAESRPAGEKVSLLGELRVNEEAYAEVGSPLPARVTQVLKAPGDVVKKGDGLVELESAEVGKARAGLETAIVRTDLAKKTLERRRSLATDQIVANKELEAAEADFREAEAEQRAARAALTALGVSPGGGARFTLTAPLAGTVIDRAALRGRLVDSEHPLFVVGDLSKLWLFVHAFERDALRAHPGAKATVSFPALPGQNFPATIALVGSRVDPTSRTVDVRLDIENPTGMLRPGMSASALVPLGASGESVVAVPVTSLQRLADGWVVFLAQGKEEGVFEIRPVGRGRDLGGEVEVLSGLMAGERVVVDGAFLLKVEAEKARGGGEAEHHH
jgi:cobalt-zinc-cadmium efflux system membrane fusion protein